MVGEGEDSLRARRILVTGCAGFIGSHLAASLLNEHAEVIGIDCFNDNYGRREKLGNLRHLTDWDGFEFAPIDLAQGSLEDLVSQCELIFHLAAEPGVRTSWGQRYEQYSATTSCVRRFRPDADPGDPQVVAALAFYGQTKVAMERLCSPCRMDFGGDTVGLRYFTGVGPRQRPDVAFHRICLAALDAKEFVVFGDGGRTRYFTYVGDAVAATK